MTDLTPSQLGCLRSVAAGNVTQFNPPAGPSSIEDKSRRGREVGRQFNVLEELGLVRKPQWHPWVMRMEITDEGRAAIDAADAGSRKADGSEETPAPGLLQGDKER